MTTNSSTEPTLTTDETVRFGIYWVLESDWLPSGPFGEVFTMKRFVPKHESGFTVLVEFALLISYPPNRFETFSHGG